MYPAVVNSPSTTLTAGISDSDTTIPVTELGVFPTAPNTATIGTGVLAETIYYAGKSAATGAGNLTSVTREWNKTGTYGAKKAWLSGEVIGREFTAYDLDTAKANIEDLASKEAYTEGLLSIPTIAYVDATHISVTTCDCLMRDDAVWGADNILWKKTIAENTNLAVTADSVNYIYVLWSGGTGVYAATTDRETLNWSDCIPVARVAIQTGSIPYQINYGLSAKGSSQKNFDRVMRIRGAGGIEKETGLTITATDPGMIVTVAAGYAWFGLRRLTDTDLPAVTQGAGGVTSHLWYHTGASTWTKTDVTTYNNTQYDKLTAGYGLTTLSNASKYAVNWIFRNLVTNEIDIVLGNGDYTSSQAEASLIPVLPPDIQNFYLLCGRIIVGKNNTTPYAIENVTTTSFRAASTTVHSDLSNLTYGTSGHTGFAPKEAIVEVTGTTQAMAVNTPYIANNGALVTLTLPATAALGDFVAVEGKGAGGWKIAQNASQYIRFISISSVAGVGGSIASTAQYDVVRLLCTTANNGWTVIYSEGNLSVVTA